MFELFYVLLVCCCKFYNSSLDPLIEYPALWKLPFLCLLISFFLYFCPSFWISSLPGDTPFILLFITHLCNDLHNLISMRLSTVMPLSININAVYGERERELASAARQKFNQICRKTQETKSNSRSKKNNSCS